MISARLTYDGGHSSHRYGRLVTALFLLGRYAEAEAAATDGLKVEPGSASLQKLLADMQKETADPPAVQAAMHKMRADKRKNAKLQKYLEDLNKQGEAHANRLGGASALRNAGGSLFNYDRMNGFGASAPGGVYEQTEEQMRTMARAMGNASDGKSVPPTMDAPMGAPAAAMGARPSLPTFSSAWDTPNAASSLFKKTDAPAKEYVAAAAESLPEAASRPSTFEPMPLT